MSNDQTTTKTLLEIVSRLFFIISVGGIILLIVLYYWLRSLSLTQGSLAFDTRIFAQTLIANFLPILVVYVISYLLVRRVQAIGVEHERGETARKIAGEIRLNIKNELDKIVETHRHLDQFRREFRATRVDDMFRRVETIEKIVGDISQESAQYGLIAGQYERAVMDVIQDLQLGAPDEDIILLITYSNLSDMEIADHLSADLKVPIDIRHVHEARQRLHEAVLKHVPLDVTNTALLALKDHLGVKQMRNPAVFREVIKVVRLMNPHLNLNERFGQSLVTHPDILAAAASEEEP